MGTQQKCAVVSKASVRSADLFGHLVGVRNEQWKEKHFSKYRGAGVPFCTRFIGKFGSRKAQNNDDGPVTGWNC